jgi:hypothetical protein
MLEVLAASGKIGIDDLMFNQTKGDKRYTS